MILNYISVKIFLISFAIGIFFVYINGEELKHVYIYPTPENIDKIIYKDKANNCFMYQPTEVECPNNINLVSTIPTQL
jgi:hypothetical protein